MATAKHVPKQQRQIRIGFLGVGMHFQETYTMALKRSAIKSLVDVVWVADLEQNQELALKRCHDAGQNPECIKIQPFEGLKLPSTVRATLDEALVRYPVDAVVISTPPEQHRAYAEWAIAHELGVMIDKPVTSRANAMTDEAQAMGILDDWQAINDLAVKHQALVMVNSHRRFHPVYRKVGELLKEVADRTSVGVTSIMSYNSDGQWRLPQELQDITYHGYNTGNGVLSHFGYHYLDMVSLWYQHGTPPDMLADRASVSASFSSAQNYAKQMPTTKASKLLAKEGEAITDNDDQVRQLIESYGEVDAFCSVDMMRGDHMAAHISVNLLHSGFSQRAWAKSHANLYKDNGRVRWENHLIQQGPMQAIEVRSFQAVQPSWKHPEDGMPRWDLGGADHLEINVYRNSLLGGKPLEVVNAKDLVGDAPEHDVMHEHVKAETLKLFAMVVALRRGIQIPQSVDAADIKRAKEYAHGLPFDLSLIESHQPPVAIMAASYGSYARRMAQPTLSSNIEVPLRWSL